METFLITTNTNGVYLWVLDHPVLIRGNKQQTTIKGKLGHVVQIDVCCLFLPNLSNKWIKTKYKNDGITINKRCVKKCIKEEVRIIESLRQNGGNQLP